MSTRFKGQVFGPGFPGAGAPAEFDADGNGIRLRTAGVDIGGDGAPRWDAIDLHQSGWDGKQLRLEWVRPSGAYSLAVGDAAAAGALRRLAAGKAGLRKPETSRGTRGIVAALVFVTVGLPLLLLGTLAWQHERIAAWAVSHIPVEQEARLGEIFFEQHRAQLRLVEGPALDMVRGIGTKLTRDSKYRYRFHVAEDKSVNAFAMPGGYVVVHTGLIQLAQTPEELAGVLAHEVQHVEQRHGLRGMAQSLGLYAALSLLVGDTSGLASLGGRLLDLKFSRDHETEADREGLQALVKAGINPAGMRDFFGRLAERNKLEMGLLSTHPASAGRMAEMDRMIRTLPEAARQAPPLLVDYAAIKAGLGGLPPAAPHRPFRPASAPLPAPPLIP